MKNTILVGIVCGTMGSIIVLRGLSLMGDAMSHAVLPGVAFADRLSIMYRSQLVPLLGYDTSTGK